MAGVINSLKRLLSGGVGKGIILQLISPNSEMLVEVFSSLSQKVLKKVLATCWPSSVFAEIMPRSFTGLIPCIVFVL